MWKDLFTEKWIESNEYKEVIQHEAADSLSERLEAKAKHKFWIMTQYLIKHFDPWYNEHLYFALFSEKETAKFLAQIIIPSTLTSTSVEATNFESNLHGRIIDLTEFESFLKKRCHSIEMTKNSISSTQIMEDFIKRAFA